LKCATGFTLVYLIYYEIVNLTSARHRASFSKHKPISDRVAAPVSVGLPVIISHTQNTTQVVDSMMVYVIISPLSANIKVTPVARLLAPAR